MAWLQQLRLLEPVETGISVILIGRKSHYLRVFLQDKVGYIYMIIRRFQQTLQTQ
jgi:hypothetical protein